ncbi:MAG: DUF2155 domain-containing protein, partial [Pseudomonadota bacterium]
MTRQLSSIALSKRHLTPLAVQLFGASTLQKARSSAATAAALVVLLAPAAASAERMENEVAIFAALDKVTARIKQLEVPLNETIEFGALKITPRVCYSRPATERPKTT